MKALKESWTAAGSGLKGRAWLVAAALLCMGPAQTAVCRAEAPSLPPGLEQEADRDRENRSSPSLPSGLGGETEEPGGRPSLPEGLDGGEAGKTGKEPAAEKGGILSKLEGFWEVRAGARVTEDPVQDDASVAETRLQLGYGSIAPWLPRGLFQVTGDLIFDAVAEDRDNVDLERGEGAFDLRESWVSFTPLEFADVKLGRQILTWGTGDLIFLNDLFPKDYQAFFLGRDIEYLKAPSDALKLSLYSGAANLDVVYTPRFDPDRYVDGSRLSFNDPSLGGFRGEETPLDPMTPADWFDNDEIAARLYRTVGTYEAAAYAYSGYWKGPAGTDPDTGRRTFPALSAYGASIRGPVGPGIGNVECSWYDSREDRNGNDPSVRNSEFRFLMGWEQEIARHLTLGLQYYLERMLEYGAYRETLPEDVPPEDEHRQWVTVSVTRELMAQQQLVLHVFTFFSLSGGDVYVRPRVTYDVTDDWKVQMGGNVFLGDRDTFFGRFENNSNVYGALRCSF